MCQQSAIRFALPRARQLALIFSGTALLASVYLGYLLVFVIKVLLFSTRTHTHTYYYYTPLPFSAYAHGIYVMYL